MDSLRERESANAAKQAQREYYRNWRKKNPEKVKEYKKRFFEKLAAQSLENCSSSPSCCKE